MFNYQKLLIILTVISVILSIGAIKYFFSINSLIAVKKNTDLSSIIGHDIKDTQCKFATIGHLYSITQEPKILNQLVMQLNAKNFDAVIFAGDLTVDGTEKQWEVVNKFLSKINSKVLFVPGNHDLINKKSRDNWLKYVGYLSQEMLINECNFILLNSTNSMVADFKWDKIVSGNGIDDTGIEILKHIDANRTNLVFMHHTLYSSDLWLVDHESPNEHDQNAVLQEKKWNKYIVPLLRKKVKLVYTGDWHSRIVSITVRDGIVYIANGLAKVSKFSKDNKLTYTSTYVKDNGIIINRIIPITLSK